MTAVWRLAGGRGAGPPGAAHHLVVGFRRFLGTDNQCCGVVPRHRRPALVATKSRAADVGTESLRLGGCCRANRAISSSELRDQARDAESPTPLVIPVGEGANGDFQVALLAQREVGATRR